MFRHKKLTHVSGDEGSQRAEIHSHYVSFFLFLTGHSLNRFIFCEC